MIFRVQYNDTAPRLVIKQHDSAREIVYPIRAVRGAIIWPTRFSRAYFLLAAQLLQFNNEGKCPLVVIYEATNESPSQLFHELLQAAFEYSADVIYADLDSAHQEMVNLYSQVRRYAGSSARGFTQAPLSRAFTTGLDLINEWLDSLRVPKQFTQIRNELDTIGNEDRENETTELKFPAVRALTFLVNSLELGYWGAPAFELKKEEGVSRADPRGWT